MISPYPPHRSGVAYYTSQYVRTLAEEAPEIEISVVTARVPGASEIETEGRVSIMREIPLTGPQRHFSFVAIIRTLRHLRPSIVHLAYGPDKDYGGRIGEPLLFLMWWLRIKRIPCVVSLHSAWLPYEAMEKGTELSGSTLLARVAAIYFEVFFKRFANACSKLMVVTAGEQNAIPKALIAAYKLNPSLVGVERMPSNYHGANPINFTPRQVSRAREELGVAHAKVILTFGLIRPDKRLEDLIRATALLHERQRAVRLFIIGAPQDDSCVSYACDLERLVQDLRLDHVVTMPLKYVSFDAVNRGGFLAAADIVVFPYARNVGPSGAVHYALAHGKPVIVTGIGHHDSLHEAAITVPPRSVDALAETIDNLLANPARLRRLAKKAHEYAQSYPWSHTVRANLRVYEELLCEHFNT